MHFREERKTNILEEMHRLLSAWLHECLPSSPRKVNQVKLNHWWLNIMALLSSISLLVTHNTEVRVVSF